jgi:predicted transcriptional regulator
LLQFDFRNGSLRKKFDSLKYTLKKMETTLYEQSLTENLGFRREAEAVDAEGAADAGKGTAADEEM